MLGKTAEGIQHYEVRQNDWTKVDGLVSHNWWHYSLYYIERNDFERARTIFEDHYLPLVIRKGSIFNILDSASFLYRLKLIDEENDNTRANLWNAVHPKVEPRLNYHVSPSLMIILWISNQIIQ